MVVCVCICVCLCACALWLLSENNFAPRHAVGWFTYSSPIMEDSGKKQSPGNALKKSPRIYPSRILLLVKFRFRIFIFTMKNWKTPAAGFFLGTEKISQPPLFIGFVTCAVSYSTTCKYTYLIHLISSKFLLFRLIFQ